MRLGVIDVGSNTVHLLVVDAHHGAHPWPAHSEKTVLRLAEQINGDGTLSDAGARELVVAVHDARRAARRLRTDDLLAFATSAVRDATNSTDVLTQVHEETGVRLQVLPGEDEARLTFLAVRRWFGWSAGRLAVLDIGGGSLEISAGIDEVPDIALSLPLGAGRLTREQLRMDRGSDRPPPAKVVTELTRYVEDTLEPAAKKLARAGRDWAVATSKTFRSLARLAGAAPYGNGLYVPRRLTRNGLRQVLGFIRLIPPAKLSSLGGVSASRAHQLLAGAVVAEVAMRRLDIEELEVCPWALREGVILRRFDQLALDGDTTERITLAS